MPAYIYECDVCGKRFEMQRHFGAPHPTVCPEGHEGLHRVFSPPNIIFKGSGFYSTDHAHSNGRRGGRESKEEPSSEPEKKESKTKTKEEEKA